MKTIIAGSRQLYSKTDSEEIKKILNVYKHMISCVLTGMAEGPDKIAYYWAVENGIDYVEYNPDWSKYGRSAGIMRNEDMGREADLLIAFWDGKSPGTKHMIEFMFNKNKPFLLYMKENGTFIQRYFENKPKVEYIHAVFSVDSLSSTEIENLGKNEP